MTTVVKSKDRGEQNDKKINVMPVEHHKKHIAFEAKSSRG
jgi:hypothetical protein